MHQSHEEQLMQALIFNKGTLKKHQDTTHRSHIGIGFIYNSNSNNNVHFNNNNNNDNTAV